MEPVVSLPWSQQPSTGLYPEPDESSSHYPILSVQHPSQYYPPTYILVFLVVSLGKEYSRLIIRSPSQMPPDRNCLFFENDSN
jgi:hypothetical protein